MGKCKKIWASVFFFRGLVSMLITSFTCQQSVAQSSSLGLLFPSNQAFESWQIRYFSWRIDEADSFRFELSMDAEFSNPIEKRNVVEDRYIEIESPLEPGTFWWRVTAIVGENEITKTRSFIVENKTESFVFEAVDTDTFYHNDGPGGFLDKKNAEVNIPVATEIAIRGMRIKIDFSVERNDAVYSDVDAYIVDPDNNRHKLFTLGGNLFHGGDPANFSITLDDNAYLNQNDHAEMIWNAINLNSDSILAIQPTTPLRYFSSIRTTGNWQIQMKVNNNGLTGVLSSAAINFFGDEAGSLEATVQRGPEDEAILSWQGEGFDRFIVTSFNDATLDYDTLSILNGDEFTFRHFDLPMDTRISYIIYGTGDAGHKTSKVLEYKTPLLPISGIEGGYKCEQVQNFPVCNNFFEISFNNPNSLSSLAFVKIGDREVVDVQFSKSFDGRSYARFSNERISGEVQVAVFHEFDTTNWLLLSGIVLEVPASKPSFQIAPNPTPDRFTLYSPMGREAEMVIMDVAGKVVHSQTLGKNITEVEISLGGYPNGIYFVKIDDDELTTLKIIKQ